LTHDLHEVSRTTLMVPMRDGVRLATDIYLPAGPGPFPALLERTPYGRDAPARRERTLADPDPPRRGEVARRFAAHGYAVVEQDCRGRFDSEGRFTKYLGEAHDGADTMAWLLAQPWCNGRIGTFGLSYAAHTQTALASQRPKGLAAMFLECGGFANAWRGGIRHGGAFELKQAIWAHRHAEAAGVDIAAWFRRLPWRRGDSPLSATPDYENYLFEQWERGRFDDYWRQPELYAAGCYEAFDGIPVMLMCGWWDPYAQTTTDNYAGISRLPRGNARLVLGPWTHGERSVTFAGDVDFGPQAVLDGVLADDYLRMRLDWFDLWLKGKPTAADSEPCVRYFRMGGGSGRRTGTGRLNHGGRWLSAPDWPVPGTAMQAWCLHADGGLWPQPAREARVFEYEFDPACPAPTLGGSVTSGEPLMEAGAYDQGPPRARSDVLSFVSEPLGEDLEVTGTVTIELWISSSAPDTDFTAKLIDVYPDGYAMNLTDGILRCRYRRSPEQPQLLAPGEVAQVTIEPMPTSNLFCRGHRIRLDISSSNFPRFDVNPNTGGPEGDAAQARKALNRVHVSPTQPSRLMLPVVRAGTR